jgi:hypothetical protein
VLPRIDMIWSRLKRVGLSCRCLYTSHYQPLIDIERVWEGECTWYCGRCWRGRMRKEWYGCWQKGVGEDRTAPMWDGRYCLRLD